MAELFGEATLSQNAAAVCLSARLLLPDQRYERLAAWVLPGPGRASFRLVGEFHRTATPSGQAEAAVADAAGLSEFPESAWLLSPAIELVTAAKQTGQLDRLAERVETAEISSPLQARRQTALLCMISVACDDLPAVTEWLNELFFRQRQSADSQPKDDRWIDLLVLWSVASNPAAEHLISQELLSIFASLPYRGGDVELDVIDDYLQLLYGRGSGPIVRAAMQMDEDLGISEHFAAFSYLDASTHGNARPLARYFMGGGVAHKLSGHETDFLTFRSPVQGDYEVDCEFSTQPGHFTSLLVAGTSLQPLDGGNRLRIGSLRKPSRDIDFDPPLEPLDNWTRYRAVVRGDAVTHFINGREVFRTQADEKLPPWIAFRSWRRASSIIRYAHITGTPQIPDSIELLSDVNLSGWSSYYAAEQNDGLGNWHCLRGDDQTLTMIGQRVAGRPGSYEEDVIRYLRPMFDDGSIEYEYFYEPGATEVHPSWGRLVFLIEPKGIRIHQLTDGLHDQTELRPDNAIAVVSDRSGPFAVPLLENAWNRVLLRIAGNELSIAVNGQAVYQHEFDFTNSRIFGLFHYADQTSAAVRNVILSGQWPRTLPSLAQQPLASRQVLQLDQSAADLPAKWAHDFRSGMPRRLFDISGDRTSVSLSSDGVRVARRHDAGIKELPACLKIDGDFDIVAEYADLEISPGKPTWHCGAGLEVTLDNSTRDRLAINRRTDRMDGKHYVAFDRFEMNDGGQTVYVGGQRAVDESTSGRLRLARRGEVIYALHAIGDSPSFRVISSEKIPVGPIGVQGLTFVLYSGEGLRVGVTWKSLAIAADRISLLDAESEEAVVATLNKQREQLPARTLDFTKQSLAALEVFSAQGSNATILSNAHGVSVRKRGEQRAAPAVLFRGLGLLPDFDVQADLEVVQLDRPKNPGARNEVVLQVYLYPTDGDDFSAATTVEREAVEASLILRHKADGESELVPRVVGRNRLGRAVYRPIRSIPIQSPDMFRIALYNRTLYYLYSEAGSTEAHVAATYPIDHEVNAGTLALSVNVAEEGGIAETRWKKISIFGNPIATHISPPTPDAKQGRPALAPATSEP